MGRLVVGLCLIAFVLAFVVAEVVESYERRRGLDESCISHAPVNGWCDHPRQDVAVVAGQPFCLCFAHDTPTAPAESYSK